MDLLTAKTLVGKPIKIAPRDGQHAHVIAKTVESLNKIVSDIKIVTELL